MDPRGDARACPPAEFAVLALPSLHGLLPTLPPQVITTGKRRDCIRLRGLPYEASINDIVTFLGDCSRQIVTQGIHLIYSAEVWTMNCTANKVYVDLYSVLLYIVPQENSEEFARRNFCAVLTNL